MKTKLLEFPNSENHILRGIISLPDEEAIKSVICLHGFERCSTTEKKFKKLSDSLVKNKVAVLRLDFAGCGLSDGDFTFTTIDKQANDFVVALTKLKNETGHKKIHIVAHSLGACVLAAKIDEIKEDIGKVILIAPALNQKDLLRYWFVTIQMKQSNSKIEITWQNFNQYLDETAFQQDCKRNDMMTRINYIDSKYFLEAKDFDFSKKFNDLSSRVLHIHGLKDNAVPIESINTKFENQIIIENGDHDLERPDLMTQWLDKAVDFLLK